MKAFFEKFWQELLLFSTGIFLLFYRLGNNAIQKWDEQTNINVVKETLHGGNLLNLSYHSSPFFEKPPLWYYLNIFLSKISNSDLYDFRLVSAISGVFLLCGVYFFAKKYFSKTAAIYSILCFLATGQFFYSVNRFFTSHTLRSADLDSLQIALIFFSFFGLIQAIRSKSTKLIIISAILSALAYLTKGPFGLLPFSILIYYYFIKPEERVVTIKFIYIYLVTLIIGILPWHIYMWAKYNSQFTGKYIEYHLLSRSLNPIEGHNNNLLYYFRVMHDPRLFFSLPLLLISIFGLWKLKLLKKSVEIQFLLLFIVLNFIILMTVQTKLAWYLFYIYPYVFILTGVFLDKLTHHYASNIRNNFLVIIFLVFLLIKILYNMYIILKI